MTVLVKHAQETENVKILLTDSNVNAILDLKEMYVKLVSTERILIIFSYIPVASIPI